MPRRLRIQALLAAALLAAAPARATTNWKLRIRAVGDFLLAQQTRHGAIPDAPGSVRANENSNMEHALLALAYAYRHTGSDRFRRGFRAGIAWLAERMETREKGWVGSWRYAYSAKAPYFALPTSPGEGAADARGLSATSGLFVYLVVLYTELTGDTVPAKKYRTHCRAALEFILDRNLAPNGLVYNGWQRIQGDGDWTQFRRQRAVDQAAVYLGLRAGYYLLQSRRIGLAAQKVERQVFRLLYDTERRVFAPALRARARRIPPGDDWESYFTQGCLAWVFGRSDETRNAVKWLEERHAPDGSIRAKKEQQPFTLAATAFCLATRRLDVESKKRIKTKRWLRDVALTAKGGIRDFAHPRAPVYNNLAGWTVLAWASADPFPVLPPVDPAQPRPTTIWGWPSYWRYYYRRSTYR